jgi:hypothetical protein
MNPSYRPQFGSFSQPALAAAFRKLTGKPERLAETQTLPAIARQVGQSLWRNPGLDQLDIVLSKFQRRRREMIWRSFVNRLVTASRRRGLATAVVYGLSLAVRFTSAAGEEVEIPAQSLQRAKPLISILAGKNSRLPYENWDRHSAPSIVFRSGWSLGSPGCSAGM